MSKIKEPLDLVKFTQVSIALTGSPDTIERNRCSKNNKKKIDRLERMLHHWMVMEGIDYGREEED